MYNLVRFLVRYHLLLLFLALEALSFYLIFRNSPFHYAWVFNTSNALNGFVYNTYSNITEYLFLKRSNDSLATENAALKAMLNESKYFSYGDLFFRSDTLSEKFIQRYAYLPAKVIRNSIDNANNIIYLDKGLIHGVTSQMGVVGRNGIVGQVIEASERYCAVMSVLNKDFKVSAKIKKNNYFGNLRWNGIDPYTAKMEEVPKHVPIEIGDTVVTSGYSTLFPENILVGVVKDLKSEVDKPFMQVDVRLSTNFHNLDFVYIVKDFHRSEIMKLDSLISKKIR